MKRFQFQLATVLDYKNQVLDSLMIELSAAQERERQQTMVRDTALHTLEHYDAEYNEKRAVGITVLEAMEYETGLDTLERKLRREEQELLRVRKITEAKRQQVVEARKETHSLERLKDIRQKEYNAAEQKEEEKMLDDLTAAQWARDAAS